VVVTAVALAALAACAEDVNDGPIYVTQMYGDGCAYDEERGGVVFRFDSPGTMTRTWSPRCAGRRQGQHRAQESRPRR
jgi:hypothetical protein